MFTDRRQLNSKSEFSYLWTLWRSVLMVPSRRGSSCGWRTWAFYIVGHMTAWWRHVNQFHLFTSRIKWPTLRGTGTSCQFEGECKHCEKQPNCCVSMGCVGSIPTLLRRVCECWHIISIVSWHAENKTFHKSSLWQGVNIWINMLG